MFGIKKQKAFTLAEVLLALTIIGVVAAMAIPSLINNTRNEEYVAALKKFYGSFNEALIQYAADSGTIGNVASTPIFTDNSDCVTIPATPGCVNPRICGSARTTCTPSNVFVWQNFGKYFNNLKDCTTSGNSDCWASATNVSGSANINYNDEATYPHAARALLANGTSLLVNTMDGTCYDTGEYMAGSPSGIRICGEVIVDVNGLKKPNKIGKDTFAFYITDNAKLIPEGSTSLWDGWDWKTAPCGTGGDGQTCGAQIIENGWKPIDW